ncbi:MAG: hypothetical protein ACOY4U_04655 [Pseudomonadota bacterium]
MAIVRLDYQRSMKPFPWAGAILLALALAMLALVGGRYYELTGETAYWEAIGERVEHTAQRRTVAAHAPLADHEARDVALEIKHANEVLRKLTLPWESLFRSVEAAAGRDVTLLAMEPDMEKRVVKISGEAKNISAVFNYIQHLGEQEEFGSVYLQSHQVQHQDPEQPVRFALSAAWRAAP